MSSDEPDLVARIATGDGSAVHHLYAQYGSLVYSIAARVTQDQCAAEDVARQVFIRVTHEQASEHPRLVPARDDLGIRYAGGDPFTTTCR